jgi:hypothetical protein
MNMNQLSSYYEIITCYSQFLDERILKLYTTIIKLYMHIAFNITRVSGGKCIKNFRRVHYIRYNFFIFHYFKKFSSQVT